MSNFSDSQIQSLENKLVEEAKTYTTDIENLRNKLQIAKEALLHCIAESNNWKDLANQAIVSIREEQ